MPTNKRRELLQARLRLRRPASQRRRAPPQTPP